MMSDKLDLTSSGWPRPLNSAGLPVPWVSPSETLAIMDQERLAVCAFGTTCAVCGEPFDPAEKAYCVVRAEEPPATLVGVAVHPMDNGILHRRCLLLAAKMCPSLLRLQGMGVLRFVRVPATGASSVATIDGQPKALFDGEDCLVVTLDSIKGDDDMPAETR